MVTIPGYGSGGYGVGSAPAATFFNDPVLMGRYRLAQMLAQPQPVHPIRTGVEAAATALQPVIGAFAANKINQQVAARRDAYNQTLSEAAAAAPEGIGKVTAILASNPDTAPMASQTGIQNAFQAETMKRALANAMQERGLNLGPQGEVTPTPGYGEAVGQQKAAEMGAETPALVTQGYALNPMLAQRAGMTTGAEHQAALPFAFGEAAAKAGGAAAGGLPYIEPTEEAKARGQFAGMFGGAPSGAALPSSAISGISPGTSAPSSLAQAQEQGLHGDDFLKSLNSQAASTVKGIAEGRIPVSPMMVRTKEGMALLGMVSQYDPTFDASNYGARASQRKNYEGGGKQFQELQAIGTVAGHLKDFKEAADALNNTSIPLVNTALNMFQQATGDPRVDKFNTVKQAVTNELSKAYRGGMVTEGDVKQWQDNLNSSKSPEQLRGVIGQLNDLLMSKRQAIEEGYKQTMGAAKPPAEFSSVNDRTRAIFDDISKWAHGEQKGAASPGISRDAIEAEMKRRGLSP